jgi:YD repeat-containing protein
MPAQLWQTRRGVAVAALILFAALVSTALAAAVSYTYDATGRLTTARYDNGICVAYGYDANGNRTAQTNTSSGAPIQPTWGSGVWGCFEWSP